jgi:hypothetical protein
MLAIAAAESRCDPAATLQTPQEYSVGPFQINLQAHPWVSEACARDPICAARAAWRIWSSSGFGAWTTWRTGAWQQFASPDVFDLDLGPLRLSTSPQPVGDTWVRPALLVVALILLVVGVLALRGRRVRRVSLEGVEVT